MATLQKLRNTGPLLVIFVGLALFAFIAGDAWRLFQSHTTDQSVGSVNGEELSAMEFQKMYEEYTNIVKFVRGTTVLTEDEMNNIKDEVWSSYINEKLIKEEAEKAGVTVTSAELQAIVDAGVDPILQQTPFRGANGGFDKDLLNNFLAQYEENKDDVQFVEQYKQVYDYWKFIEKTLMHTTLANKLQALVQNSFIGDSIVAVSNYNANSNSYDIEVAAYPYSALQDADFTVSDSDIKKLYNEKKETFKQAYETRNIKYVTYRITPSSADRTQLNEELTEYADSLKAGNEDYATLVRLANSEVAYSEFPWQKSAYPEEVQVRLDSTATGSIVGPIFNQYDDSYTVFKLISKNTLPDSIQYRMLAINAETEEKAAALTDSLMKVLKGGANFKEVAKNYQQEGNDSIWITSAQYEGRPSNPNDAEILGKIIYGKKGGYSVIDIKNSPIKVIYQILDTKNPVEKYNVAVIKRKNEFSKDTYNASYNNFSQYVASCKTIADLEKNAEEYGFRVMTQNNIHTGTHKIANISDTRDALRWIFSAKEEALSPLYECGENDQLLVVALSDINEKGYTSIEDAKLSLNREALNNLKAEKILTEIKGKGFEDLKASANVKTCETKRISFSAPAYISATSSNEPAISAAVSKLNVGEESAPIVGKGGVYVIKLVKKDAKGGEFNKKAEEEKIKLQGIREAYQVLGDLIQKANIEDNRYLFF